MATARADQLESIPEHVRSQSEYNVLGGAGVAALGSSQADLFVEDQKFPDPVKQTQSRTESTLQSIVSIGGLLTPSETPQQKYATQLKARKEALVTSTEDKAQKILALKQKIKETQTKNFLQKEELDKKL